MIAANRRAVKPVLAFARIRDAMIRLMILALMVAACARGGGMAPLDDRAYPRRIVPVQGPPPQAVVQPMPAQSGERFVLAKPGETIHDIATAQRIPVRALIDANALKPPYALAPGQRLVIPTLETHTVQRGDTLYGISRRYGVDMASLAKLNGLDPPYTLHVGRALSLRGQRKPPEAAPAAPAATGSAPAKTELTDTAAAPEPEPEPNARGFAWPVSGQILSGFGPKDGGLHNDGINIALRPGTPIRAARAGQVAYAGNELKGYGNLVLLRHEGGWMTAYAHNQDVLVKRGESVRQGQVIARAGNTGGVREPQLHFELRRGSQAVDPLKHLPPRTASAAVRDRAG